MTTINRRALFCGVSALALTACTNGQLALFKSASVKALAADAKLVLMAMQSVATALQKAALPNVPASVFPTINTAIASIDSVVAAISAAAPTTDPADLGSHVVAIASYVNAITSAVAVLSFIPSPIAAYLNAATIIVPVLAAAVQVVISMIAPPPPPAPIPTVDAARAIAATPVV